MSTEVGKPITVVNPATGEVLTLAAPTEDLGRYLADMREHESLCKEAKSLVNRELLGRLDHARKWTVEAGDLKLSAPSAKPQEIWDGAALREALLPFVDSGELAIEAVDAAVEQVIDFKVHKSGINALRAGGGAVAETVDSLCSVQDKARYISVSRST